MRRPQGDALLWALISVCSHRVCRNAAKSFIWALVRPMLKRKL